MRAGIEQHAGRIEAAWTLDGDRVIYRILVPPGAGGTLVLDPSYQDAVIDGSPVPSAGGKQKSGSPLTAGYHDVTFRIAARPPDATRK